MKIGKQSVFYNAFFMCLSSIGLQLIGFLYRIGLSRFGGAQVMGMYQLIMPAYSVIMSFTMSGLTLAVSRLCAQYQAAGDAAGVRGTVRFAQLVFLCLFTCAAIPVCLFPDFLAGVVLGEKKIKGALLLLVPCLFLTGFENIFKSSFHGIKYILPPIVSELTEQLVRTIAGLGLLLLLCPSDPGAATAMIVLGMVVSEVFSVVILLLFYKRASRSLLPRRPGGAKIPKGMFRRVAVIAVPVSSAGLLNNFLSSATTVLIPNRLIAAGVSPQEAMSSFGVMVGMTMPLLMLPTAFIHPLNTVLLPRFSQYSAKREEAQTRRKAGKAIQVTGILTAVSLAVLLPVGKVLAQLIYKNPMAGNHLLSLSAATVLTFYHITTGSILNGIGMQKQASVSIVVTGISEIVFTWMTVGAMGIGGYALACIGSELVGVAMNFYWVIRGAKIKIQWKNWFVTPFLSGAAAGCTAHLLFASLSQGGLPPVWPVLASVFCAFAVFFLCLSFLGIRFSQYLKTLFARS